MNEIDLPDDGRPATIEEKLRAAVYQASMYYWPTKISYGHRVAYLIDQGTYERLVAKPAEPTHMSTLCVCGQNQQTAPFPGGNMFAAHNDKAGDPCPGLPLPFPPIVQEEAGWTCRKCGSSRWVAASLTGPVGYGGVAIKQCVSCGEYSGDKVPPTVQEADRG